MSTPQSHQRLGMEQICILVQLGPVVLISSYFENPTARMWP